MKPAALLVFLTDIHAIGLEIAQGLVPDHRLVLGPRRQEPRFRQALHRQDQEASRPSPRPRIYSATLTYLNAVKAVGTTDADKVMDELHKTKIRRRLRPERHQSAPTGCCSTTMYIMQVKTPSESKGPWDYYKLLKTM